MTYYSAWYYSALHVLMSVPGLRSPAKAAEYLQLDPRRVANVLEFLSSVGLIAPNQLSDEPFQVGKTQIHLGSDSPLISKHHTNWRLQAIRSLEKHRSEDLHYSSVVSISVADAQRIRELLVKEIERVKAIVRASPEELVQCFSLDFFEI